MDLKRPRALSEVSHTRFKQNQSELVIALFTVPLRHNMPLVEACRSNKRWEKWDRERRKPPHNNKCVTKLFHWKSRRNEEWKRKWAKLCHRWCKKLLSRRSKTRSVEMFWWIPNDSYLKMSPHSGCAPLLAFLVAWSRHGSSMMQAFGPSSLRICRSAMATLMADADTSGSNSTAWRRFLPVYVPANEMRNIRTLLATGFPKHRLSKNEIIVANDFRQKTSPPNYFRSIRFSVRFVDGRAFS